jgi:hyperosmotically inducible protein
MEDRIIRPLIAVAATAALAGSLLSGCEKRTTTVNTPSGRTTATTVEPNRTPTETVARAGDVAGDAAITAKVKTALLADPDVKALQIDVDTHGGVVTLNGTANGRNNVDKAVQIAKRVDGVKSVENRMTVKTSG